jgi:hypothetical protein
MACFLQAFQLLDKQAYEGTPLATKDGIWGPSYLRFPPFSTDVPRQYRGCDRYFLHDMPPAAPPRPQPVPHFRILS